LPRLAPKGAVALIVRPRAMQPGDGRAGVYHDIHRCDFIGYQSFEAVSKKYPIGFMMLG